MNPHQSASIIAGHGPRVINGEPSMINYLDALNAFELVREADDATGKPAGASFKHVSPAGAALAGPVDATAARIWRVDAAEDRGLLSAYVRARDAESKRGGGFLVLEADPRRVPPGTERRDVHGVTIEQDRDTVPVATVLPADGTLNHGTRTDALLGLVALQYTQSNSVAFVRDGAAIGIGAGQQNRVDCVRLAGAKARTWWLRRHPFVDDLPGLDGLGRQDRLNWQIKFAGQEMTPAQLAECESMFGTEARSRYEDKTWRSDWVATLSDVTMTSDGYLPFRDNVEHAATAAVSTIVEPGGSARTSEVIESAAAYGIAHVQTGLRLFHH